MGNAGRYLGLFSVAVIWICALGLQRPPPRYSQQYMPETSFSCRNKIVGSYYADPETDCQLFHVCVSVAGSIQDFKFLCPNDTAFDQESQTCADWYDVDCEAATLYYASDNFDLYRIGSGLESVHYDSLRSDSEPQDHLQRSESSDPVRSSSNNFNKVSTTSYNSNSRDVLRGSSSGNFYNRNGKEDDYENEKTYKEPENVNKKKTGVRKISRKQPYNGNNANNQSPSTTAASTTVNNYNNNNNYYNNNNYNQRTSGVVPSTTARPFTQDSYNRNRNTQKYNVPSTTVRPSTNYQNSYSTTSRTTAYNSNYNTNSNYNGNEQTSNAYTQSTTTRPTNFNKNYYDHQSYTAGQYNQPTTIQPSTSFLLNDYTSYPKPYNHQQRGGNGNAGTYPSTTAATTAYDNYNNYNGNGQYRNGGSSNRQDQVAQTTTKYFSSYAPTTYSPATKKYVSADNSQAQTISRNANDRYNGQDDGQYYDKSVKSSTQYYDSTKAPKKATQYNNDYDNGKYYTETSTGSYDFGRSPAGIGFSPSSINHLAETPKPTTASPRRASSATTYNPSNFSSNTQRSQQSTTPRVNTFVSPSARPFSSTTRLNENTTVKPKSSKKNDYDYAYYDNAGTLEYDGLELEHVTGNKESSKIARN